MIRPKPTAISLSQTDVREHISNINRKRALRKQAALGIPSSPVTSESAGSLGSPGSPGSPRQPLYALDNIEPLNPEAPSFTPKFTSNQGGGSTLMATTTLPSIGDSYSLTIRPRNSSVPHSGGTAITIGGSIVRSGTPGHAIEQESRIRARIREAEEQRVLNHNSNAVFHIHDEAMETMNPDNGGSGEDSFSNDDFASDEEIASSPPRPAFDYSSDNEGDVYPRATTSFTASR